MEFERLGLRESDLVYLIPNGDLIFSPNSLDEDHHGGKLGDGEFGFVIRGELAGRGEHGTNLPVAIKIPKKDFVSDLSNLLAVYREARTMIKVGTHQNVLQFLGFSLVQENDRITNVLIVVELGTTDLRTYLSKNRKMLTERLGSLDGQKLSSDQKRRREVAKKETQGLMLSWCVQIASAMEYLQEKQIVHADLATRNVIMFGENCVKVSDFGLARQLYKLRVYQKKSTTNVPFYWMALESIAYGLFTSKSDVWSFGIAMWEIFTLGRFPFMQYIMNIPGLLSHLEEGGRLDPPKFAPDGLFPEIQKCWNEIDDDRPEFQQLVQILKNFVPSSSSST